jgi:hypothetical protein
MINGKVPEGELAGESFTWAELSDAAKASPWTFAHDHDFGKPVNIEFAVRWLAEWIVLNKREHFEAGEIYVDHMGRKLLRRDDDLWPWVVVVPCAADRVTWAQTGWSQAGVQPDVVSEEFAARPLRKLVPEDRDG